MWDTKTLQLIKTIDVQGGPDGILADPFNGRIHVFSHSAPNDTVIDAKDGTIVGTIDLGGAPEQAATDGNGHIYVDIEDKGNVGVIDTKAMTVTAHYELGDKGSTPSGLGFDAKKNKILFVACRQPQPGTMVINERDRRQDPRDASTKAGASDGAVFNPATMEAFSTHSNGTLTVIKETSPTAFEVEQNLQTMAGAKTVTLDSKTSHVLTMTADYGPTPGSETPLPAGGAPAGRAGGGRARGPMLPDSFTIFVIGK